MTHMAYWGAWGAFCMFGALASCVIGVGIMALLEKYSYFKYWWVSLIPAILFGIAECVCFAISVLPV